MKRSTKKIVTYTKDRAVLSDTLPYETPLTFSNRHFYRFLKENKITLVDVIDKTKTQLVHFEGKQDEALKTVVKTLFQTGDGQLNQEIRFDNALAFQIVIDQILLHLGWTCFTLNIGTVVTLKIKDKKAFSLLISKVEGLKRELKEFNACRLRIHINGKSPVQVLKICEGIILHYSKISSNILKYNIHCSTSHFLYPSFKSFSIVKENWVFIKELRKVPFNYKISHKEADYRELSIPHPK
ncbi:MAG TPA: hypothetical protein VFQ56_07745, partial [Flavobacterium sp.]|nr:hypothetical protein [Flavobacterium sp.]